MRRFGWGVALSAALAAVGSAAQSQTSSPPVINSEPHTAAQKRPSTSRQSPAARSQYDVVEKSIPDLQQAMASGQATSHDLTAAYLARIDAYDHGGPAIDAMIALNPHALADADALDRERTAGHVRGPLHGIPILVKDNFETKDMPTTGGTVALAGFETHEDAFQVRKLRDAGVVIVGKTNMHELAAGITSVSSLGGQTRNPYNPRRNPGGSSGGTGAGVAASFGAAGMGSDTCGSIRIPSGHNNLVGLRGTLGLSSRNGIIPLSHTQDIGGPLARSVTDLAIMLDATVGEDDGDQTTSASRGHIPHSYRDALNDGALKGVRIGALTNLFGSAPEDQEVGGFDRKALDAMKAAGAEVQDVTIAGLDELLRGSSVINFEFKFDLMDYLARFPSAPVHSLGEIIERGEYDKALEATFKLRNRPESRESEEYRRARVKRAAVRDLVLATMEELRLDVLAYPPLSRKAAIIGEPQTGATNCQLSAASGLPAISMPAGFTDDGVPVGVELLGRAWTEPRLLAIAYAYEQATHLRRPPPTTPPLVDGKPPKPTAYAAMAGPVHATFQYDATTLRLSYHVAVDGAEPILAAGLHRVADGENGPAIVRLVVPGERASDGELFLIPAEREALTSGKLYVETVLKGGRRLRATLSQASR